MGEDVEPIKTSTLATFEWNPVDAYMEHLKEIDDPRVSTTPKSSEALRAGEELHDKSFGLLVSVMPEDTGEDILKKMRSERVTAINHGDYQIQGAPDQVHEDEEGVRIEDMKTTGWDDKSFYKNHQFPQAKFQVRIYSWMLDQVPDVEVKNPRIAVKQRVDGSAIDWFTEEVQFDPDETEEKIEYVLSMLEQPTELAPLRPEEDWKNEYWDEFLELAVMDNDQKTLGDY